MSFQTKHMLGIACLIALGCSPAARAQEATLVRITTDPADAALTCDGVLQGTSPVTINELSAGDHLLIASRQGYQELRRTISLVKGQRMALDMKLKPLTGLVLVHTVPSGADVQVDGADRGRTPALISDLPPGRYRVRLSMNGFLTKEVDLSIEDRTPQRLNVNLTSDSATLILTSEPTGATVTLNGLDKGHTPCTIDRIAVGDNALELRIAGFEPFSKTVRLTAGQSEELRATLTPLPGRLSIVSIPPGARIYVDNQFRGESPLVMDNLEPGEYRIRAELLGHDPVARTVQVGRDSDITEEFRLTGNTGRVQITTQPSGVSVFIDGKEAGKTTTGLDQTDRVSEPLTVEYLAAGTHTVELVNKGYYSKTATVEIETDKTVTLHQILQRRFIPNYEVRTTTDVITGVLLEKDPLGNIRLETRPGIMRTIAAAEITSHGPLRVEE